MYEHPTAAELLAAARAQLEQQVIPTITEPRLRFQTLVAANVLAIVERELADGETHLAAAWQRMSELESSDESQAASEATPEGAAALRAAVAAQAQRLCARIRAGEYDQGPPRKALLLHLRRTAEEELAVANPRYLERVKRKASSA
jgi:hypothetical protein